MGEQTDHDLRHHPGKNGRRHEVDFGDSPVRVEVYASEVTIEIFIEADFESLPEERWRFALINVPRQQFTQATGKARQEEIAETPLLDRTTNSTASRRISSPTPRYSAVTKTRG
jgi:hypothetical protein